MSVGAVLKFCHLSGKLLLGVGCSHHTWAKSGTRTSFSVPVPGLLWYHAAWMELFCSWWLPCDGRNTEVLSSGQKQTLSTCIICLLFFFYIFSKLDAYILSWESEEDILSSDTSQSRSLPIYVALFNFFCCFYFSNKLKYLRRSVLEQRIIWGSSTAGWQRWPRFLILCAACFCISIAGSRERSSMTLAGDYTKLTCRERKWERSEQAVWLSCPQMLFTGKILTSKALFRCVTFHHTAGDVRINV